VIIEVTGSRDGGGDETFAERNAHKEDRGAELFRKWCDSKGYRCYRIGADPKDGKIPRYWELPEVVRYLPDFVLDRKRKNWLIEVKGSPNLKTEEYEKLTRRESMYGPNYRYAICWQGRIAVLTTGDVALRYEQSSVVGRWGDGKKYRELDLSDLWEDIPT
jgi:hypothetical protein